MLLIQCYCLADDKTAFRIFLNSIFYIGKGLRSRPYSHFKEALKAMMSGDQQVTVAEEQLNMGVVYVCVGLM